MAVGDGHQPGQPTGTVSFLLTDIVGSTSLWERRPEAMRAALARHDEILRQAIRHTGASCSPPRVMPSRPPSGPRVRRSPRLETLRQYGAGQLGDRGETGELRARHLTHYREVAERAREWFEGDRNADGRRAFDAEWDNLRAALEHAEATGDHPSADRIVRGGFWYAWLGARDEHGSWVQRRARATPHAVPEMIGGAGLWAASHGDYPAADRFGRLAIAVAGSDEHPSAVLGWWAVTLAAWFSGHHEEGRAADTAAKAAAANSAERFTAAMIISWPSVTIRAAPAEAPALVEAARALVH